jgi:hypothetical protein
MFEYTFKDSMMNGHYTGTAECKRRRTYEFGNITGNSICFGLAVDMSI